MALFDEDEDDICEFCDEPVDECECADDLEDDEDEEED